MTPLRISPLSAAAAAATPHPAQTSCSDLQGHSWTCSLHLSSLISHRVPACDFRSFSDINSPIRSSPVPRRLYPFSLDAAYVWNCLSIAMRSQCRFTFLLLILAYFPLVLLPVPHSPPPVDIPFFICQIVIPLGQGVVLCCVLCTEPCAEMALYKLVRFQN